MYSSIQNVNILTYLLVAHGIKHVVVCPGSRNAPLVHNFNECPDLICHPVTDERSAGFMALGLCQATGTPTAVCVTSGSALLNVLPAVAEATYQRNGFIIISADRPQAWIDQLDGQTLPQQNALGTFVSKSYNLPEIHTDEDHWYCNRMINEALINVSKPPYQCSHLNVPISEPLFTFNVESLPEERVIRYSEDPYRTLKEHIATSERPMVVIGQLPYTEKTDSLIKAVWSCVPVLCEPLSSTINTFTDQALCRISNEETAYSPDLVIYLGGHTISKRLRHFLRRVNNDCNVLMINEEGRIEDVTCHTTHILQTSATKALDWIFDIVQFQKYFRKDFYSLWESITTDVEVSHSNYDPSYSQMLAVKIFEETREENSYTHYANSMSIRLAALYANHHVFCNRGVNGIEGSLSTAAGFSLATDRNVYCVIGDLSFFYDENALWQQQLRGNFRILLLNNAQGGIFRNLNGLEQSSVRDTLISGSHRTTAEGICHQFGITHILATDKHSLREGIQRLCNEQSQHTMLLEVLTDINSDEHAYKDYYKIIQDH